MYKVGEAHSAISALPGPLPSFETRAKAHSTKNPARKSGPGGDADRMQDNQRDISVTRGSTSVKL